MSDAKLEELLSLFQGMTDEEKAEFLLFARNLQSSPPPEKPAEE